MDGGEGELTRALDAIVLGDGVKRGTHALGGHAERFRERLLAAGFRPLLVGDLAPSAEERIPAFLVRDEIAIFGHVFHEKFTARKSRLIFGSVVRDSKGDWAIQLGSTSRQVIFAAPSRATSHDPDAQS